MVFYDLIVLGGGLAGCTAALTARSNGKKVLLITRGYGTCYQGSGTVDFLGHHLDNNKKLIRLPGKEIEHLDLRHPYRIIGKEKLDQAFGFFRKQMNKTVYPLHSRGEENYFFPTALGSYRPSFLAPRGFLAGDIRNQGKIRLIGFAGFHYLAPGMAAQNMSRCLGGREVLSSIIDVGPDSPRPLSPYDLALWFDSEKNTTIMAEHLRKIIGDEEILGFPAVLGVEKHHRTLDILEGITGRKVFEIPTIPPSVPGIRFYRAMTQLMIKSGIDIIDGYRISGMKCQGKRVTAVQVAVPGRDAVWTGKEFILATGRFRSGGLTAGPDWIKEDIFDLPLHEIPPGGARSIPDLFSRQGQPYARVGIKTDARMQPLDAKGEICLENLYAAGSILAYCDGTGEKSTGGIDIITGWVAGNLGAKEGGD